MLWFKWVFLVGVLGVSVHFVLSLCYMCLGLVASSSLTSGLSRLHQSYTAGVVHKLPFERSERGFYGRKQRYTLSLLPSSPLLIMPLVLNSYVHVMGFSRVGSWVLRSTLTDLPSCHSWQILKSFNHSEASHYSTFRPYSVTSLCTWPAKGYTSRIPLFTSIKSSFTPFKR